MKKSKKALLWTIVPVLGVSSGVAGAVAGVTNQKTSVDTNNVATSSTATTMATRRSTSSELKIVSQSYDVASLSEGQNTIYVSVSGASSKVRYEWSVNKGEKWEVYAAGQGANAVPVSSPKTNTVVDWTFRCKITDPIANKTIISEDVKFTTLPSDARYISISQQPEAKKTVNGGQEVTLTTKAISKSSGKTVGYQWFEYDSSNNKFIEIENANESSYTFIAPSNTKTSTTKKYFCRYYFVNNNQSKTYLNESRQSIITINRDAKETFEIDDLGVDKTSVKVGDTITLSVEASSTKTTNLKYQWLKSDDLGKEYKPISTVSTSSSYVYTTTKEDEGKELLFCVLVTGTMQDDMINYFQSDNVKVKVLSSVGASGTTTNETFVSDLSVTSSVTTNQASVRSTFYPVNGIKTPEYTVSVKGATGLTYKWYYVSGNKKQLISGADKNVLTTNKSLYEAVYKANDKHRVEIVCEIYKGDELVETVDQSVNSRFYMTVVIARR